MRRTGRSADQCSAHQRSAAYERSPSHYGANFSSPTNHSASCNDCACRNFGADRCSGSEMRQAS